MIEPDPRDTNEYQAIAQACAMTGTQCASTPEAMAKALALNLAAVCELKGDINPYTVLAEAMAYREALAVTRRQVAS